AYYPRPRRGVSPARPRAPPRPRAARMTGALGLPGYSAHAGYLIAGVGEAGGVGPPAGQFDDSGFYQLQAVEERGDLLGAAEMVGVGRVLVVVADGVGGGVAGGYALPEGGGN